VVIAGENQRRKLSPGGPPKATQKPKGPTRTPFRRILHLESSCQTGTRRRKGQTGGCPGKKTPARKKNGENALTVNETRKILVEKNSTLICDARRRHGKNKDPRGKAGGKRAKKKKGKILQTSNWMLTEQSVA